MRRISPLLIRALLTATFFLLPALSHQALWGQTAADPTLVVTGVNDADLPFMRVTVYGANLGDDLANLPAVLKEDGAEQPILDSQPVEVGVQSAILIDLSANVLGRYNEIADAVDRFPFARLSAATDWLAAYTVVGPEGNLNVLADWSQDHQGVSNQVRVNTPVAAEAATPLFGLISQALDRFETTPAPPNLRRSLFVFSDGGDIVSAQQLETITRKAARQGVAIHTIMIGSGQNADSRRNLEQIAFETGGQYWDYSTADKLDQVEKLWQQLGQERTQQQYTYRLTKAQPREVSVAVTTPDGNVLTARRDYPTLPVAPPTISVLQPAPEAVIVRQAAAHDTPLGEIQPTTLPIQLDIVWPDGHPRLFDRIEYELGGRVQTQRVEPFGAMDFPIDHLDVGRHTLRVTAFDELGFESKAEPVSIAVEVIRPEPPTATPTETPTEVPTPTEIPATATPEMTVTPTFTTPVPAVTPGAAISLSGGGHIGFGHLGNGETVMLLGNRVVYLTPVNVVLALLPVILVIAAVVLFVYMRRRPRPDPYTLTPTEAAYDSTGFDNKPTVIEQTAYELTEDATEPEVVQLFIAPASLLYETGGEHLPPKLDIEGGREVRIGRRAAYCDVVIDDQRVSRLHASITEREDGKFYLKDEGSSGGTYVNKRKLRVNDMVELHHNDLINFNTVAYKFVLNDQPDQAKKP